MHLHPTAVLHHISTYTAHPRKHGYSSIFHSFLGMITESKHLFTRVQIWRLNRYVLHGIKSQVHRWYTLCVMYRIVSSHRAKYRDLSVASRSIICPSRRLRQIIIDLRDTEKSRYFAITEFNNCFIIRSPSLFFNEYLREGKRSAILLASHAGVFRGARISSLPSSDRPSDGRMDWIDRSTDRLNFQLDGWTEWMDGLHTDG